jgi:hypothetical protein
MRLVVGSCRVDEEHAWGQMPTAPSRIDDMLADVGLTTPGVPDGAVRLPRALTVLTPSKLDPPGALYHNGWDRAYYDQTAQEETMMAFTAMLSELYDAFRRKIGADEPPAKTAAEAVVIEDARFRSIDGKFDALNHTMDQRFDAVSQRFDVLNQPIDGLSRVMDQRFDALNHAMDQRFGAFGQGMDQRFGSFGQAMGQRLDALDRMIDERFATVDQRFAAMDQYFAARDALLVRLETKTTKTATEMDAQLARLETKTATEFRHLRWGLGIVILLVLGLVTKVILDWAKVILDWAKVILDWAMP